MATGNELATAYVSIVPSFQGMREAIRRELGDLGDQAGRRAGEDTGRAFGEGFRTILSGLTIAAFAEFSRQAIVAAGDLEAAVATAGQVFGGAIGEVEAFADQAADSLGQSKRAALEAATTFGQFGKAAGMTGADLAGFSTDLTALASDMAAFKNTRPEDAVEALGAALRGESEPIRDYGVLLEDATLRQRALALGIVSTTKDALTPQQRVLAAQAEIWAQTRDIQGQAARESDQLGMSTARMNAQFENAQAAMGQAFLPIATKVMTVAGELLKAFNALPEPVQSGVLVFGALATAFVVLYPQIMAFRRILAEWPIWLQGIALRVQQLSTALRVGLVGGLTAAVIAFGVWMKASADARAIAEELAGSIHGVELAFDAAGRKRLGEEFLRNFSLDDLKQTPFTLAEIVDAAAQGGQAYDDLKARVKSWVEEEKKGLNGLNPARNSWLEALNNSVNALGRDAEAAREVARASQVAGEAAGAAADETDRSSVALDDAAGAATGASGALTAFGFAQSMVETAFGGMKDATEDYLAALSRVNEIQSEMDDMRFEAGLRGLDDVAAATARLAREQEKLAALRFGTVEYAEQQREVLATEIALEDARYAAAEAARQQAEEAARAAEEARERLTEARVAVAESIGGNFIPDLLKESADGIDSTLSALVDKVRSAVSESGGAGLEQFIARSNARLTALADKRDSVVSRLEKAKQRLEQLEQQQQQLASSLASAAYGSTTGLASEVVRPDAEGVVPSAAQAQAALSERLNARLQQVREFAFHLRELAARGLPKFLLRELIDAGPVEGLALARILANSADTDYAKIIDQVQTLEQESQNLGDWGGQEMYGAGVAAAQGLIKGLQDSESAISKQMQRIATIMVQTIRASLGIRSPSRAFAKLGGYIGDGLAVGIDSRRDAVLAATEALVKVPNGGRMTAQIGLTGGPAAAARGGFTVQSLTINNPTSEPASTSVAGGLRRTAYMLGA